MNKPKMILAVTGGTLVLAMAVAGYFLWSAFAAQTAALEGDDETDGLETYVENSRKLCRKPVYPSAESVKALDANETALAEWRDEARKLASHGDRVFPKTTPAAFKTFLVGDAKRLAALNGRVDGVFVKPDFAFGPFKPYISGGLMPEPAKLPELQRQWDDVATVVSMLAECGVAELLDVQLKAKAEESPEAVQPKKSARKARPAKKKAAAEEEAGKGPSTYTYVFSFAAKPSAFVKVLNALETGVVFMSVDDFAFVPEHDTLSERLGGEAKKASAEAGSSRRRRRGAAAAAAEAKKDEKKDDPTVTDPRLDPPLKVTLTVTATDFRSLEGGDEAAAAQGEAK